MADKDLADIGVDPEDIARYHAVVTPVEKFPQPPPTDHPMVQYAQKILAPLVQQGMTTPRESGRTGQVSTALNPNFSMQPQLPQGFNHRGMTAAPNDPRGAEQNIFTPGNRFETGNFSYEAPIAGFLGRVSDAVAGPQGPLAVDISNPLNAYGPAGHLAGYVPEAGAVAGAALRGGAKQVDRINAIAANALPERGFLAGESGYAQIPGKGPLTQRFETNAAGKAATATPGEAANLRLAEAAGEPVAPGTGAALKPGSTLAERQIASLKAGGASDEAIAAFAKTMAPAVKPRGVVTSAEGQAIDAGLLTRSLQTAAGTEGVPLSQHPAFADYGSKGVKGPKAGAGHGGDIGTATRAVMSGDSKVMELLGPELTQQLIQNKIAQIVRQTGAPEDVVRKGLSVMGSGPEVATADATTVATVGKNVRAVEEALGVPPPAPPPDVPVPPWGEWGGGGAPPKVPPGGGGSANPFEGLPSGVQHTPPLNAFNAGDFAKSLVAEIAALPRALKAGLDLSAVLLQGSILISKDVSKLPFYAFAKVSGKSSQRPYFASAIGQMFKAVASKEARMDKITEGFRRSLRTDGFDVEHVHIADPSAPFGKLTAREEYMVGDLTTKIPILGLLYRQGNYGYATLLNALRVGEARNLAAAYRGMGMEVNHAKIGHFVNIATGYGDLPYQGSAASEKIATGLANVLFGPRLMTSSIQNAVDNIAAAGGVGKSIVSRKALDPADIARLHATTAWVAAGVSAMKFAEMSGMEIGTDPTATNFGRITLPNGWRIDLWGQSNENARLVAREIEFVRRTVAGDPPGYGEKNGIDEIVSTVRGRLNPPVAMAADWLAGKTGAGVPTGEAYTSTDPNINPLIPAPFSAGTALEVPKDETGLALFLASFFGASVMAPSSNVKYDGIGRGETNPSFGKDIILDEYTKLFPGKQLEPPDSTLGSGKNTFALPPTEREAYVRLVGNQRRVTIGELLYSQDYQNATKAQQEKMYKDAQSEADSIANRAYLKNSVISATEPDAVRAEAVTGFHAQPSNKDKAYWIATLDKAGKLTPDVKQAIEDSNVALPGQAQPITVDEYLRAAPLVHEYLVHAAYGTDAHPLGTADDWAAVDAAKKATTVERDRLIRSGVNPSIADTTSKATTLKSLTNPIQRNLYLNGSSLVNPQRTLLAKKYGTTLTRFLGPNADITQESAEEYP